MTELPDCRKPDARGKRSLPPDEFDLKTSATTMLKACPFCGRHPITMCTVNDSTGIYGCRVECCSTRCGASVLYTAYSREEARTKAIERWDRRV